MVQKRVQLTLFVDATAAAAIESVRRRFNPAQFALIAAHATLCREDELVALDRVLENLAGLSSRPLVVRFGPPQRFSEGKGLLLPAIGDCSAFHRLRADVLKNTVEAPRRPEPHITLMHPRNSSCTDAVFEQIKSLTFPNRIEFDHIALIEQEAGKAWQVRQIFSLKS